MTIATIGTYFLVTCLIVIGITIVLAAIWYILDYHVTLLHGTQKRLDMLQSWVHNERYAAVYADEIERLQARVEENKNLPHLQELVRRVALCSLYLALAVGVLGLLPAFLL
jgi:hypothetical protein